MGKFDGVLLCTDLDGTLLKNDKTISAQNLEAITYFKAEGGVFTFITGRMPFYAMDFCNTIRPNAPIGCINGGGLYDCVKQDYIWTRALPHEALALAKCMEDAFPGAGIQINTFYKSFFCKENKAMERFRRVTNLPNLVCPSDAITEPVAKIVFGSEDEAESQQIERTLRTHPMADQFDFVRSEKMRFEVLPKGVGKGTAITMLAQHLHIDRNKTVAVGDYNNDISMFRAAKIGIAVANACPEALSAADHITVSNEEHAIAAIVCDLDLGRLL